MAARFGTDGIRGVANAELSPELVLALGRAAARVLPAESFLIGRDTRRSGPMLQAALASGMASEGADVVDLGVLPTPGVAWLSDRRSVPAAVVSASHNPFSDNGVKLLAAGGLKLPDSIEADVEDELLRILDGHGHGPRAPVGHAVGRLTSDPDAAEQYADHLVDILDPGALDGLKIVIDCANGAGCELAPGVLERLGATVSVIAGEPDGSNINDGCGSTHPEALAQEVLKDGADLGLALDGDADRLVAVDHEGSVRTGDELLVIFAADLAERGQLAGNTVAVTVMSNLGLHRAMAQRGILVRETPVGDRYILEALDSDGLSLGGEQSGHLVFRRIATTGDGTLTGILLADLVNRSGRKLAELAAESMVHVPQLLVSVTTADPAGTVDHQIVRDELAAVVVELGEEGRVLVRASGTEPVVRVMVEATDAEAARSALDRLCDAVAAAQKAL
ncbi:MAG: phosphoglucosamine mutase [Acidimicrobiales bacterium]